MLKHEPYELNPIDGKAFAWADLRAESKTWTESGHADTEASLAFISKYFIHLTYLLRDCHASYVGSQ